MTTSTALSLKLLVDSKAQRVLFVEAGKDVVDFLFSLLTLPVATAVKLVGKEAMVGCASNLYGSVEELGVAKAKRFYRCSHGCGSFNHVTDTSGTKCPTCSRQMATTVHFVAGAGSQGSAATGIVTYTVTDDLTVTPMSNISTITLLNTFPVKDIAAFQKKTVHIGYNEVGVGSVSTCSCCRFVI